jgi:hypothetical protein
MKIFLILLISISLFAKEEEHHEHKGKNNIKLNYEILEFKNSKKKLDGKRAGVEIDHQDEKNHIQFYYEKSDTKTTKIVPKDLEVNKYTLIYQRKLNDISKLYLSYSTIDDNIMKETDGGKIYGIGYQFCNISLIGYLSDYHNFDVYQADLNYETALKHGIKLKLISKYIHLKDKNSNNFSKKAKQDYFTQGIKLHTHYKGYHLGASVYLGERIFAVMKNGLKVQHHAMEFKESYMCGVGHSLGENLTSHLRYAHHKAKEVPSNNDNVKVDTISIDLVYKF